MSDSGWESRLGQRPAGDDGVNFGHDADGFGEGHDDFLVMVSVVVGEVAAFAVLEPLFADVVAADVKFPYVLRNTFEVLRIIDSDHR